MRLVLTSDWHGSLPEVEELPEGDVLIVAGDIFPVQNHSREAQWEFAEVELTEFLERIDYKHIVLIAGNHDFLCQEFSHTWYYHLPKNVTVLTDEWRDFDGVAIWGSPWCNKFGDWAYMALDEELEKKYDIIPRDIDVLVSHGPPYMACDRNMEGEHCGSLSLRDWVVAHQPKLVVTGHIHEGYGSTRIKDTDVFNVSRMNRRYVPTNPAVTYEV